MQEYWEHYVKAIDTHKAMVAFNASVADFAPDDEYTYVGFVKVKLNQAKEDGLVNEHESDDVSFIEDRLEMESLRWRSGKYIGRIITQGEVNFIYYLKLDFEWENTVEATMSHFPDYTFDFGSRVDSQWEVYQKLLFPTLKEWQIIANHHSCDKLKEQGDSLHLPRAIEHKVYFKNQDKREIFTQVLKTEGFTNQKNMEVPFNNEMMYGTQFYRVDTPYYYDIDELTINMLNLSEQYEGIYDGWECSIVKV